MERKDNKENQIYAADIVSIREAQLRIAPYIHRTPVLTSTSLDFIAGKQLFFKCECFQKGGHSKLEVLPMLYSLLKMAKQLRE
ncbi:Serine racemase [Ananas comosus]|uniref:Serine racemase n=1 Tax=Ananas comosus TaxID=4615 RepID=A0A199W1N1_ANACO|nr:Serine racemase [Ananas comosus]